MTKTKRQLRAEAVERLERMDEWCDEPKTAADFMKALLWDLRVIDGEHVRDALIDLLTDPEPPEGDVTAKDTLRGIIERHFNSAAVVDDGSGKPVEWRDDLVCYVGFDFGAIAEEIADMVERDYVLRSIFDAVCAERDRLLTENADDADVINRLAAERDEWKARAERGMTNLERLYENDEFFNRFARWYATVGGKADDDVQADEWLMTEHVDDIGQMGWR